MISLNARQEAFAQEVVRNGGNKVEAFKLSGWSWQNMSPATLSNEADKKYNHPKISPRIAELKKIANEVAEKKFTISVEQRLRWLNEIVDAGLSTYSDQHGNTRREALSAADKAINTMNSMLGIKEDDDNTSSMNITFNVVDARRNA